MAYDIFQSTSKAPTIDVNLFPNAATAGINAGNALPSTTTSIIQGLTKGVQTGLDIQGKILANEQTAAENAVLTDPAIIEAKRRKAIADAQIAEAEAALKRNQDTIKAQADAMKAKADLRKSTQEVQDFDTMTKLDSAIDDPGLSPDSLAALTKQSLPTLARNNEFAQSTMVRLEERGVPKETIDSFRKVFDAEEIRKQNEEFAKSQQNRLLAQKERNEEMIQKATAKLATSSTDMGLLMSRTQRGEDFNPALLDIVPAGQLQADPGRSGYVKTDKGRPLLNPENDKDDNRYAAVYDGQIVDYFSDTVGADLVKALPDYRMSYATNLNPGGKPTVEAPPAAQGTPQISPEQLQLDRDVTGFTSEKPTIPSLSPESMEGKSPESIARMEAGLQKQIQLAGNVSREYRGVVRRVNSNPVLAAEKPIIKAVASVESSGKPNSISPTNVKGYVGMTRGTFDGLVRLYPGKVKPEWFDSEEGKIAAAKVLIGTLYKKYYDLNMVMTAYNAGEAVVDLAKEEGGSDFNSPRFQEALRTAVIDQFGEEKWEKETKNYAKKVMKYFSIYNR